MPRILIILLAVSFVITATPLAVNGQDATTAGNPHFNPHVPTIWHKIGVPQSVGRFKKFRETRVNRKGNHPEREKKPKLKKLADAANLDPNALKIDPEAPEMIKAAAKIKKAEDLAPQKLKALKYLGTLGCGCYNKKNADMIEGALLEALDDCTPAIRKEALNVIQKQIGGGCSCSCEPACNPKSCCTAKIYKKLEEMANKTSDTGCPAETDPSIKALALQVLNACPYPVTEPEEEPEIIEEPPKPPVEDAIKEDSDLEIENGKENDIFTGDDPGEEPKQNGSDGNSEPIPDEDLFDDGNQGTIERLKTSQISFRRQPNATGSASLRNYSAEDREYLEQLEVTGVIRSVRVDQGNTTIVFDDPYEFPEGLKVIVATGRDYASFGTVQITKTGTAVIEIEDDALLYHLQKLQRVRLGIIE